VEGRSTDRNQSFEQSLQLSELGPDARCCCSSLSWGRMPIADMSLSLSAWGKLTTSVRATAGSWWKERWVGRSPVDLSPDSGSDNIVVRIFKVEVLSLSLMNKVQPHANMGNGLVKYVSRSP